MSTSLPSTAKFGRSQRPNLNRKANYFNRELSWLKFNERVLEEAENKRHPLLERVKFLAIFARNLDEFFMIRVSGLRRQLAGGALKPPPDGMSPSTQLTAIRKLLRPLVQRSETCWSEAIEPKLRSKGVRLLHYEELTSNQRKRLRRHFKQEIFPTLTPLAFDPSHPFPHISNLSLNLAVVIRDPVNDVEKFARLKVPHMLPRLLPIPGRKAKLAQTLEFVWLEGVVAANLDRLFPGMQVEASYPFRITRDADFEIEEDEASDLLSAMEEVVGQRQFGSAVRIEIDDRMPHRVREILTSNLALASYQIYSCKGPLGRADLMQLSRAERPDLKDKPFLPAVPAVFTREESIFNVIKHQDVLLYHPYDSFNPVTDFIREAANDPDVLAIKQTLYRVGPNSLVVQSLKEARENGKQVSVLVELKARFDEQHNIVWARELERAGVHVVYGVVGLKTHAKMCLVVRREGEGLKHYVHLGTGNYNPLTARTYSDLGLFTTNPDFVHDVSQLFNALTGYSGNVAYRKLLVAPDRMRKQIIKRIEREIKHHKREGNGHLAFKMNALVDKKCIRALYKASRAGVRVDLQIRGICCLRPGIPGISESVTVTSLVGRFLEHARIFYFRNGGEEELLLGSADLMPRNLDQRVEILFPIEDERLKRALRDDILFVHLRDTRQARRLEHDGTYQPIELEDPDQPFDSQKLLLGRRGSWHPEENSA